MRWIFLVPLIGLLYADGAFVVHNFVLHLNGYRLHYTFYLVGVSGESVLFCLHQFLFFPFPFYFLFFHLVTGSRLTCNCY